MKPPRQPTRYACSSSLAFNLKDAARSPSANDHCGLAALLAEYNLTPGAMFPKMRGRSLTLTRFMADKILKAACDAKGRSHPVGWLTSCTWGRSQAKAWTAVATTGGTPRQERLCRGTRPPQLAPQRTASAIQAKPAQARF